MSERKYFAATTMNSNRIAFAANEFKSREFERR
jgi:hypothetical protein